MVSGQVNEWTSEQVACEDRQSNIGTSLFFITSNLSTRKLVTRKNFVPMLLCLQLPCLQATRLLVHLFTRPL